MRKRKRKTGSVKSLDLHGFTQLESENKIEEFLQECKAKNLSQVKIITGIGTYSKLNKFVKNLLYAKGYSYETPSLNEGGEGVLLVDLRREGID